MLKQIQVGSETPPFENTSLADFNTAFTEVAEKVTPSIVSITVVSQSKENPHQGFEYFFPFKFKDQMPENRQGGGSGVIISEDGYILTNNHVVEDAISVHVTMFDKQELDATVVGTDPLTDLAVIKVDAKDLPAAYLGDSDKLKVGSWVMAIGNPLSYLTSTVTAGIVSAIGRNIGIIRDTYGVEDFIQTDAAINPGNSGGALVDLNGAVIGINSAIATNGYSSSYIGYGFAIPVNLAKAVAKDLIENGEVKRGYIGVSIAEVDAATAKAVGLDKPKGIMIQNVIEDGAAANEDIKAGDIILKVDGKDVNKPNELQSYVATKRAGNEVELELYRDGNEISRSVKLKSRDGEKEDSKKVVDAKTEKKKDNEITTESFDNLGLTVQDISKNDAKQLKVDDGILVKDVKRFSKAANQRLMQGLVIVEVDKKPIHSVEDFKEIIESKAGDAVLLKVIYPADGNTAFIGLEIPED
ncbi:MAG: Do family serine endopeptidase [Ignavibacteriales bacterium]|nr:Do family serine endopeptidase [Ignavibacteriales bacterium]